MQPLGSAALVAAYHDRIASSHDYDITAEVLTMDETPVSPARLIDGQINIQRDADVRRTATLTLLDPDRSLELDSDSPLEGALFADRMVRIRHYVDVPGFGQVVTTPFVGPITKLNRNGATIDVECQDKSGLVILGAPPYTVHKGANAVQAIHDIMAANGETRFRLPTGSRVRLSRAYSVGWPDEASPWAVCTQIAWASGLQLFYSCDGYLTLRPAPTGAVFDFGPVNLTSAVAGDNDFSGVVNYARATAGDKIVKTAQAPTDHPFSPTRLGRNGWPRYLPSLAELDAPADQPDRPGSKHRKASKAQLKKYAQEMEKYRSEFVTQTALAQATANSLLSAGLSTNANLTWSAVPVFHLDVDDPVRLTTEGGSVILPFAEASIPLVSGDMSGGLLRKLSRPGRLRR